MNESVLIIGAGSGLSASLARLCGSKNMTVVLAARNTDKIQKLKEEINATVFKCDASNIESVSSLFQETDKTIGTPNLVIYNPSARLRGSITELDPEQTQEAARRMLKRKSGSIFFTGATAGIKGFANSSVFAMGKFGLRGLAQSLARELHPQNIHIGHFIIDGGIGRQPQGNYEMIHPD